MKTGDLVRVKDVYGTYRNEEYRIAMILEGPNEVGKIKVLYSCGSKSWLSSMDVEMVPVGGYLKE